MGNEYYRLLASVLLVTSFERTAMQDPCRSCLAGTFCGKTKDPSCIRCPSNSFSSTSGQKACDICRRCEGVFRTKKLCTPTSNAECECVPGFHCRGPGCSMCEPDCEPGQELTPHGCKDCSVGTFNDQKRDTCQPWTDCSLDGRTVLVNGTKESDVVCGPASADFSPGTPTTVPAPAPEPGHRPQISIIFLVVASTAALFLVFFFTVCFSTATQSRRKLLDILKQPFLKPVPTAQEEDGCSCRFPEEEEGEEQKP